MSVDDKFKRNDEDWLTRFDNDMITATGKVGTFYQELTIRLIDSELNKAA